MLLPVLEAIFHQIILAPSCFYAMGKACFRITQEYETEAGTCIADDNDILAEVVFQQGTQACPGVTKAQPSQTLKPF